MTFMRDSSLEIHGKVVEYRGEECGIYKDASHGLGVYRYAAMDAVSLCQRINQLPLKQARESVSALRDLAAQQAVWKETPASFGSPILQGPEPLEVGAEERASIVNLKSLCERILAVLPSLRPCA